MSSHVICLNPTLQPISLSHASLDTTSSWGPLDHLQGSHKSKAPCTGLPNHGRFHGSRYYPLGLESTCLVSSTSLPALLCKAKKRKQSCQDKVQQAACFPLKLRESVVLQSRLQKLFTPTVCIHLSKNAYLGPTSPSETCVKFLSFSSVTN